MIYFIQDTKSRAVKIGTSRNPVARMKELQVAHSAPLVLLAVMDGSVAEEHALHRRFTRLSGEWFEPTPELITFVKSYAMPVPQATRLRKRPMLPEVFTTPATGELTPIDLDTCGYSKRDVWTVTLLSINKRNGAYTYPPDRIAKLMTTRGSKAHHDKMFSDIERMVHTIRLMPTDDVDGILANAPPEVEASDTWQKYARQLRVRDEAGERLIPMETR